MTGFSPDWLALREPADTRARDASLTALLGRRASRHSPARFIDLACGTGANLRYLAPRVEGEQQWLLVDTDAALLDRIGPVRDCRLETRRLDLSTGLRALDFATDVIVTASALLDLVSDRWLVQLIEQCRASQCAALFALSYDGHITLAPSDSDDEWIRQLVNRHQLGDKGFGPALGPGAWQRACELFREAGYQVRTAKSDWNLAPSERLLQQSLLEGWADAAMDLASNEADRCRQWLARRSAHVANETSRMTVGHEDVLALPRE
ncbi:MAG: class I SAM-dependent methyltransferase [Gammaproteobacteria bacterium]